MDKGKSGSQAILAVILAVLIAIGGLGAVFIKKENKIPALAPLGESNGDVAEELPASYTDVEEETLSVRIDDFEVGRNGEETVYSSTESKEEEQENEDGYLCSYSSERQITEDDIWELRSGIYEGFPEEKDVIQMVVNEMYARYGYQFNNQEIQSYFEQKKWYQDIEEKRSDMNAIYQDMSEIEKSNVDFLSEYRGE